MVLRLVQLLMQVVMVVMVVMAVSYMSSLISTKWFVFTAGGFESEKNSSDTEKNTNERKLSKHFPLFLLFSYQGAPITIWQLLSPLTLFLSPSLPLPLFLPPLPLPPPFPLPHLSESRRQNGIPASVSSRSPVRQDPVLFRAYGKIKIREKSERKKEIRRNVTGPDSNGDKNGEWHGKPEFCFGVSFETGFFVFSAFVWRTSWFPKYGSNMKTDNFGSKNKPT